MFPVLWWRRTKLLLLPSLATQSHLWQEGWAGTCTLSHPPERHRPPAAQRTPSVQQQEEQINMSELSAKPFATRTKPRQWWQSEFQREVHPGCGGDTFAPLLTPECCIPAITAIPTQQRRIYNNPKCKLCLRTVFHKVSLYMGQRNTLPLSTATTIAFV